MKKAILCFFTEESNIIDKGLCEHINILDLFNTNIQLFVSQDIN